MTNVVPIKEPDSSSCNAALDKFKDSVIRDNITSVIAIGVNPEGTMNFCVDLYSNDRAQMLGALSILQSRIANQYGTLGE